MYFGPTEGRLQVLRQLPGAHRQAEHDRQPARHVRHAEPARASDLGRDARAESEHDTLRARGRPRPGSGTPSSSTRRTRSSRRCSAACARSAPAATSPACNAAGGAPAGSSSCCSPATSRSRCATSAGTAIMLAQAPIIGVLLALVFGGQKEAIPYWCLGALAGARRERSGGLRRRLERFALWHAGDDGPLGRGVLPRGRGRLVRDQQRRPRDRQPSAPSTCASAW